MLGTIASYFVGRAAKSGAALLTSFLTVGGGAGVVNDWQNVFPNAPVIGEYPILGYVIIGAIGGLMNWATVYWKINQPTDWQRQNGLY